MTTAFVGIGSNLGEPERQIAAALGQLAAEEGVEVVAVSALRETKPVGYLDQPNFLNGAAFGHSVSDLASMGVRRISVGGALARSAWGGFIRMTKEIAEQGTFTGFKDAAAGAELNAFFTKDKAAREQ